MFLSEVTPCTQCKVTPFLKFARISSIIIITRIHNMYVCTYVCTMMYQLRRYCMMLHDVHITAIHTAVCDQHSTELTKHAMHTTESTTKDYYTYKHTTKDCTYSTNDEAKSVSIMILTTVTTHCSE